MAENIDELFYEAMRQIGGRRPVEIDPEAAKALNADIVLQDDDVILEVKTLMSDPTEREDHIQKVSAIYHRWVGRPGVPLAWGRQLLRSTDVPREMAFELARTLADPIRTAVTKANRQIRQAKASLQMPNAHGVLVLCNSGATTMTPEVILHALHHALGKRHSSINSVIFMTHDVPVLSPGMREPADVFASAVRAGHEPLPVPLFRKIMDAWVGYRARTQAVRVYDGADGNFLIGAPNARKPRLGAGSVNGPRDLFPRPAVLQSQDYKSLNIRL